MIVSRLLQRLIPLWAIVNYKNVKLLTQVKLRRAASSNVNDAESSWNNDDNISLEELRHTIARNVISWTINQSYVTPQNIFCEETGPNLPDDVENPN